MGKRQINIPALLTLLPLVTLSLALALDVTYVLNGSNLLPEITFYLIAVGIVGCFVTTVFEIIAWVEIPRGTPAKRFGFWHGIGNGIVLTLFILSWFVRAEPGPSGYSFITGLVALGLAFLIVRTQSELIRNKII